MSHAESRTDSPSEWSLERESRRLLYLCCIFSEHDSSGLSPLSSRGRGGTFRFDFRSRLPGAMVTASTRDVLEDAKGQSHCPYATRRHQSRHLRALTLVRRDARLSRRVRACTGFTTSPNLGGWDRN
jgi:hypothetical protein